MVVIEVRDRKVPAQALLLSLLCLLLPVLSAWLFPDWTGGDVGALVWLLALLPAFLLSYYRGWKGASLALAGGMAAVALANVAIVAIGAPPPRSELVFGVVTVLILVSIGSGALSMLFQRALERTERLAFTDVGTGLPNRRHAMIELERAFAAARRGADLTVVLFDLDHFKRVNDRLGHAEGDRVLARFAEVLLSVTRTMNVIARFGGEEFVAVLRDTDTEGAQVYAERVREQLKSALSLPSGPLTVSAGVAAYEEGMPSPDVLLGAADQALYRAKASGRDRVVAMEKAGRRPEVDASPAETGTGEMPEGRGETILLVDDDAVALHVVAPPLRRLGYVVYEARSPVKALEIARGLDAPPDLVLTDIVMPEMGGFRLVELLQETQEEVRVIYLSGYAPEDVDWGGVPGAVRDYLGKPVSIPVLARRVRRSLDKPARTIRRG